MSGPSTEPCGAPEEVGRVDEKVRSNAVEMLLLSRKLLNHDSEGAETPINANFLSKQLCTTRSKAVDISGNKVCTE